MLKFSEARAIVWKLSMMSPFDRAVTRQRRIEQLLSPHTRKSMQGDSTRWMFADGSVLEQVGKSFRVVTK